MTLSSMANFIQGIINAQKAPKICFLSGLLPLTLFLNIFFKVFAFSNWTWSNCGYVTLLMSQFVQQIISSMTLTYVKDESNMNEIGTNDYDESTKYK